MKDYLARVNGTPITISNLPTPIIRRILHKMVVAPKPGSGLNPGVTREAYMERLRLELFIRELGLHN